MSCGERLCFAFDVYRSLFPAGQMSIEQVILLVTALADHALRHGMCEYVGVAEAGWYHTISKFGWTCRTLGAVHRDGACRILALSIAIDEDTLAGLKRTGTYAPLVLKFEEGGEPGR